MINERKTACDLLIRAEKGGFANLLMLSLPPELDRAKTSFVTALFYGSLEREITLDYILATLVKGGLKRLDVEVLCILRMTAYQLLYMCKVPDYAAISEGVKLCRTYRKSSAAGMVNAVLRRVKTASIPDKTYLKYSIHPDILAIWEKSYPERYLDIAENSARRANCCIYVNIKRTTVDKLIELLSAEGVVARLGFADNTLICEGEPPVRTTAFEQGLFHVISTTSVLAAQILLSKKPKNVLDLCAAPGGKTAVLALSAERVTAAELHHNRLSTIEGLVGRLGLENVSIVQNDATKGVPSGEFDAVLCDVPCTGTGVLSKRAQIRASSLDTAPLVKVQRDILKNAVSALRVGGVLCYSTCALSREENEGQIEIFLRENPQMKPLEIPLKPPPNAEIGDGHITFFPDGKIFDGFFVAFLEKIC